MSEHGKDLNRWVLGQLKNKIEQVKGDFYYKFEEYLNNPDYSVLEKKILKASHYLATNWEFQIIYNLNSNVFGINETKEKIENEIEEHYHLVGVQKIGLGKKTKNFLDLVSQLRFQKRWAHSPRLPETSVMGHMLIVAMISYLCSIELCACKTRIRNNYFAGLFHDLPEVLTRDIISPVKKSVQGLEELVKKIENAQLEEKIFPLLPLSWHEEIKYYVEDEFESKIVENGTKKIVTSDEINKNYNKDEFKPLDGEIIKACDHLSAYIEASLSISHGITSHHLREAVDELYKKYADRNIASINFGQLFEYFKPNN